MSLKTYATPISEEIPEEILEYITFYMEPKEIGIFSRTSKQMKRITSRKLNILLKKYLLQKLIEENTKNKENVHPWLSFAYENLESFQKFQEITIQTITYGRVEDDRKIYQALSLFASAFLFVIFTSRRDEDIKEDEPLEILEIPRFGNFVLVDLNFDVEILIEYTYDNIAKAIIDYVEKKTNKRPGGLSNEDIEIFLEYYNFQEGNEYKEIIRSVDYSIAIPSFVNHLIDTYDYEASEKIQQTIVELFSPKYFFVKTMLSKFYLLTKGLVTKESIEIIEDELKEEFMEWLEAEDIIDKEKNILFELQEVLGESPFIVSKKTYNFNFLGMLDL
jgi:hypothetical protein